ncbi:hypothetical protein SNEBB_007631 [Seison nebaliae]|nr:hypothetical protein SNEBB_007631 [Seison nebaliae]
MSIHHSYLFLLTILHLSIKFGESVRCVACDSMTQPTCTANLTYSTSQIAKTKADGISSLECGGICQKIIYRKGSQYGQPIGAKRSCGTACNEVRKQESGTFIEINCCNDKDYCNGSFTINSLNFIPLFTPILIIITFLREIMK